jgi:hypothetical protein
MGAALVVDLEAVLEAIYNSKPKSENLSPTTVAKKDSSSIESRITL